MENKFPIVTQYGHHAYVIDTGHFCFCVYRLTQKVFEASACIVKVQHDRKRKRYAIEKELFAVEDYADKEAAFEVAIEWIYARLKEYTKELNRAGKVEPERYLR